jgi:hypothetical protein
LLVAGAEGMAIEAVGEQGTPGVAASLCLLQCGSLVSSFWGASMDLIPS